MLSLLSYHLNYNLIFYLQTSLPSNHHEAVLQDSSAFDAGPVGVAYGDGVREWYGQGRGG